MSVRINSGQFTLWFSLRRPIYIIITFDNAEKPCITLPPTQHHSFYRNLRSSLLFTGTYFNKKVLFQIHTLINTWMNDAETSSPVHRAYCVKVAAGLVHKNGPEQTHGGLKDYSFPDKKKTFKEQIFCGSAG